MLRQKCSVFGQTADKMRATQFGYAILAVLLRRSIAYLCLNRMK